MFKFDHRIEKGEKQSGPGGRFRFLSCDRVMNLRHEIKVLAAVQATHALFEFKWYHNNQTYFQ